MSEPYLRRLITSGRNDFSLEGQGWMHHEYDQWINRNPWVYHAAVADIRKEARPIDGIARVWESLRRNGRATSTDPKLPNQLRTYLARHIMFLEGDLDGVFATRPCPADEWLQLRIGITRAAAGTRCAWGDCQAIATVEMTMVSTDPATAPLVLELCDAHAPASAHKEGPG